MASFISIRGFKNLYATANKTFKSLLSEIRTKRKDLLRNFGKLSLIGGSFGLYLLSDNSACASEEHGSSSDPKKDPVEKFIALTFPIVAPLGFGGIFGFFTGFALRKLGEKAAYIIGLSFVALQGLAYAGIISIDYKKLEKTAESVIDADGDGKISANDFILIWRKVKGFFTYNLPSAGGFSAGFAAGFYYA